MIGQVAPCFGWKHSFDHFPEFIWAFFRISQDRLVMRFLCTPYNVRCVVSCCFVHIPISVSCVVLYIFQSVFEPGSSFDTLVD